MEGLLPVELWEEYILPRTSNLRWYRVCKRFHEFYRQREDQTRMRAKGCDGIGCLLSVGDPLFVPLFFDKMRHRNEMRHRRRIRPPSGRWRLTRHAIQGVVDPRFLSLTTEQCFGEIPSYRDCVHPLRMLACITDVDWEHTVRQLTRIRPVPEEMILHVLNRHPELLDDETRMRFIHQRLEKMKCVALGAAWLHVLCVRLETQWCPVGLCWLVKRATFAGTSTTRERVVTGSYCLLFLCALLFCSLTLLVRMIPPALSHARWRFHQWCHPSLE